MKVTNDDAEIESLLRTGIYKDKETLFHDAIKALFITKPNLRYEIAIDRYRNKVISLWKAAETARLTIEEFKELLSSRGMKVEVSSSDEESDIRLKKVFHGR
jgi:predicted HTH domain antitoxin